MNRRPPNYLRWVIALAIALSSSLLGFALWDHPWLATVERLSVDLRMRMQESDPLFGAKVVLVTIDDEALAPYPYKLPTPRPLLAALIEKTVSYGAASVALELPLDEATTPADDELLDAALMAAPREVLALFADADTTSLRPPLARFSRTAYGFGVALSDDQMTVDSIRKAPLAVEIEGERRPSFPVAVYLASVAVRGDPFPDVAALNEFAPALVANDAESFHIDFHPLGKPTEGIDRIDASELLAGAVDPARLRGEVVVIGGGKEEASARHATPFDYDGKGDGVGRSWITANALATLMAGTTISHTSQEGAFVLILLLSVILTMAQVRYGPAFGAGVAVTLILLYAAGSLLSFLHFRHLLPVGQFLLAIVITYLGSALYLSVTEGREKRWIKGAFSHYLSPAYVERLMADPGSLELGGEERTLTILFTDIEGFTTIAGSLPPSEVVALLNRYFSKLTDVVVERGGTLDKYQGDSVMAFWGAPLPSTTHAKDGVAAALAMAEASEALSEALTAEGFPPLRTRIGVNTGPVIVGNIGSQRRFNYTLIGDAVNIASRLEGGCKFYGARILISAETAALLDDRFVLRRLDRIALKGKEAPLTIYEALGGPATPLASSMRELLAPFAAGVEAYGKGAWDEGIARFEEALRIDPDDGPTQTLLARCRRYAAEPPAAEWDRVFRPDAK